MTNAVNKVASSRQGFKYLTFLTMLSVTTLLITLAVQNRLILIGKVNISAGMLAYPFTYIISDVVAEVYGYSRARSIVWNTIVATFIFAIFIKGVTYLPYPAFWSSYSTHFNEAMAPILRTVCLGTLSIIVGQFINIYFITKLKILMRGRHFWLRSILSSFIGDTVTIAIAIVSIFIDRLSLHQILVVVSYELIIMYFFAIVASVPGLLVSNFLKRIEGVDVYDYATNFNPFKLNETNDSRKGSL